MTRLEDFYDVPPTEVLLTGGPHDGNRIFITEGYTAWLMPPPEPPLSLDYIREVAARARRGEPPLTILDRSTLYRWTGSVLDDGTRVFQAEQSGRRGAPGG